MSKSPRANPDKDGPPRDFEQALAELESLVTGMEEGEMTLEASLTAYKRGMLLAAYCRKTLDDAEQQIKVLEAGEWVNHSPDSAVDDANGA